jgi:hypothetical protein
VSVAFGRRRGGGRRHSEVAEHAASGVLAHDGERIAYGIVRTRRRTCALVVDRDGRVTARVPLGTPDAPARRFVEERRDWVVARVRDARRRAEARAVLPLGPEEVAEAAALFTGRFDACWRDFARPGERRPPLRVRVMRSRWGSLAPSGTVTLNAALLYASPACLDYVIYHELTHLRVRGHGADFYAELGRYVPEWRARRRELRSVPL